MPLYPLKFKPRYVEKIWGGRKIESVLGKPLPAGQLVGESWELYDFPPGVVEGSTEWVSSEIAGGPLAGRSLHWAMSEFGSDLYGDVPLCGGPGGTQFPILIKFLDAREDLSVQVHPPQTYCDGHPGSNLKSEAWYVVQHEPGARILKGLQPGVTRESFEAGIKQGTVEQLIRSIPVKAGECYYLPSGTVHALGAGILAAEVQTPSDTTFRVYDFDRIDASTKQKRKLHIAEALDCIDFSGTAEQKQPRSHVAGFFTTVSRLVTCPYFKLEKVRFTEGVEERVPYDQPVVWMMLKGEAQIRTAGAAEPTHLRPGETVLLPAAMNKPVLKTLTDCTWLEVTFPSKTAIE